MANEAGPVSLDLQVDSAILLAQRASGQPFTAGIAMTSPFHISWFQEFRLAI